MKLILSCFLLLNIPCVFAQYEIESTNVEPVSKDYVAPMQKDTIVSVPDEYAEFTGGMQAMREFVTNNLQIPERALEEKISGKCFLKFVVTKTGKIEQVQIMRGVAGCPECDREAMRVVKSMPKWKPALVNNKAVDSYFHLPINFVVN